MTASGAHSMQLTPPDMWSRPPGCDVLDMTSNGTLTPSDGVPRARAGGRPLMGAVCCAALALGACVGADPGKRDARPVGPGEGPSQDAGSQDGAFAGDADTGGLSRCPAPGSRGDVYAFSSDRLNQLVIEAPCAPAYHSGPGTVRRIERGASGVHVIEVVLDAASACESYEGPIGLQIFDSRVDWGLAVGSEVHVELMGTVPYRSINGVSGGAVVSLPDGSLLVAFYDQTAEHLPRFFDRLGISAAFEPECRDDSPPGMICQRSVVREAMVLASDSIRLSEYQSTRLSRSGATFHLALSHAREFLGYNTPCSWYPSDDAGAGRSYRFFMVRLPQP
jgi:hypothetical protein